MSRIIIIVLVKFSTSPFLRFNYSPAGLVHQNTSNDEESAASSKNHITTRVQMYARRINVYIYIYFPLIVLVIKRLLIRSHGALIVWHNGTMHVKIKASCAGIALTNEMHLECYVDQSFKSWRQCGVYSSEVCKSESEVALMACT